MFCDDLQCQLPFPANGLVYDYKLDDGMSSDNKEDDEEEEDKEMKVSSL